MARFDWIQFLNRHRIEYVTSGPNVARENINIRCPFCGHADPSHHLGIHLETGVWGCWRNKAHRGSFQRAPRLIAALLGCSYYEAENILGSTEPATGRIEDFDRIIGNFSVDPPDNQEKMQPLKLLKGFKKVSSSGFGRRFVKYIIQRGFLRPHIKALVSSYGLRYCMVGRWKHRLIFPIHMERNVLVGWTGRSITKAKIRYQTLSHNLDKANLTGDPPALMNIKHTLFNYPELLAQEGKKLYITEGPMDALKIDFYGRKKGVRATCLFSSSATEEQCLLIQSLMQKYHEIYVFLDVGELHNMMNIASSLSSRPVKFLDIQRFGVEDPGSLTPRQISRL